MTVALPDLPSVGDGESNGKPWGGWAAGIHERVTTFPSTYLNSQSRVAASAVGRVDGSAVIADTGQTLTSFGSAPLTYSSGALVHTPFAGANSAGYLQCNLPSQVNRIGVDFVLPVGANGSVALVVPSAPWSQGQLSAPAGVHAVIDATSFHQSCWTGSSESIYATSPLNLAADGVTVHSLDIYIDAATSTTYTVLPDGRIIKSNDARIAANISTYGIVELYEGNGVGAIAAKILRYRINDVAYQVGGDTAATPGAVAKQIIESAPLAQIGRYTPSPSVTLNLTTTPTELFRRTITVPQTKKAMVRLSGYIIIFGAAKVVFQAGANTVGGTGVGAYLDSQQIIDYTSTVASMYSCDLYADLSAWKAGDQVDVVFVAFATAANVAQVMATNDGIAAGITVLPVR